MLNNRHTKDIFDQLKLYATRASIVSYRKLLQIASYLQHLSKYYDDCNTLIEIRIVLFISISIGCRYHHIP